MKRIASRTQMNQFDSDSFRTDRTKFTISKFSDISCLAATANEDSLNLNSEVGEFVSNRDDRDIRSEISDEPERYVKTRQSMISRYYKIEFLFIFLWLIYKFS